jgi:DNA-directed RNA polymerase specialized sigma24 family protein
MSESINAVRRRIAVMPSQRLMRMLSRQASQPIRGIVEDELVRRIMVAVLPLLIRRYQLESADAEELAIQAAFTLLQRSESYEWSRGSPEGLARRIAACDASNLLRYRRRRPVPVPIDESLIEHAAPPSQLGAASTDHRPPPEHAEFYRSFRALAEPLQRMLVLHAEGVDHAQIGQFVDKSPGAVHTAICRARKRLQRTLPR